MILGVSRWNKVVVISICCLTCQTGSVCFPVFAVDWYMSSILFAGVTTEYTPTLPTRVKKQLCFINIYSMWVRYCRRNETDAKISCCIFYDYQRGSGPLSRDWSTTSRTNAEPVTNWKNISLTFISEFIFSWPRKKFVLSWLFPVRGTPRLRSKLSLLPCCCWFAFCSKARS